MKYEIPEYSFREEYIDDPHWNSGFWETKFNFKDGINFAISSRKKEIKDKYLVETYLFHLFENVWKVEEKKYKEICRKEFESKYR